MNVGLKICGITNLPSIKVAADNNIQNLGFASSNLPGPNTCNDSKIKELIKECNYYKISSVLLTCHQSLEELIQQIDYIKPKAISCSYFFKKEDLGSLKSIFPKLKIGIAINPIKFDENYLKIVFPVHCIYLCIYLYMFYIRLHVYLFFNTVIYW